MIYLFQASCFNGEIQDICLLLIHYALLSFLTLEEGIAFDFSVCVGLNLSVTHFYLDSNIFHKLFKLRH